MRRSVHGRWGLALFASTAMALVAIGCGGTQVLAPPRPRLGVQSNEPVREGVLLRYAPPPGARYLTRTDVEGSARLFGQDLSLEGTYEDERVVRERRADGTTVLATRSRGGRYQLTMGELPARESELPGDGSPTTTIVDPRGRTIDDALFAPVPTPARSEALRALLDSLLDALAYPEQAVAVGDHWDSRGIEREGREGVELRYALTQTLLRVEGSGPGALAVVGVRGRIDGMGERGGASGSAVIEGAYSVGIGDGVVRGMQVRVSGGVSLGGALGNELGRGGADALEVPFEGTLRYRAQ